METGEEQNMEPEDRQSSVEGETNDKEDPKRKVDKAELEGEGEVKKKRLSESVAPETPENNSAPDTETKVKVEEDNDKHRELLDAEQKLKEMDEISFKAVPKSTGAGEGLDTDASDTKKRKPTNLRKNIKDVLDDTQLDASTLAAQKEEMERLARVQEQQRVLREMQRQTQMDKFSKTEEKVLQFLQGHANLGKSSAPLAPTSSQEDSFKTSETDLTPSVTIRPVTTADKTTPTDQPTTVKKEVVTISSDEEDCIVLSDDDEIEDEPDEDPNNCGLHTNDTYNVPDDKGRVLVNVGHNAEEPDIFLAPQLGRIVKPHQIGGIRFLFDNIIESTSRYDTSTGFGCILAHSMGLGKTLQVVSFCDIFLRHTSSKTVLIIMPINTLQNWLHEFNMWVPDTVPDDQKDHIRPRQFKVFILNDNHKTLAARSDVVFQWAREGGVLMIGYEMYRLLSMKKMSKTKRKVPVTQLMTPQQNEEQKTMFDSIHEALVCPGPDLVICDEGHRIKNSHASTSIALKQIKSKRRVVLTGYPLQNNLMEYWCMVDFVRPNYLGTKTEFANMFERPIQNGQCIDSTPQDCKLMRYRAHVLHSLLLGFVQRRSHRVLQSTLPMKQEFVVMVRMTTFQRKLYDTFMNEVVRTKNVPNPLKAFAVCCKIWNHPDVLYNFLKKREADIDLELDEVLETASSTSSATSVKKRGRKAGSTKDKNQEVLKPVALQPPASTPHATGQNNAPPSYSQPPPYNPYSSSSSSSTGSSTSNSYHSAPNSYHNNMNPYYNNSQPGNNGNFYPNYNQNYWPGYYGQEQYNPQQYYGQSTYQSQGWFDQKTENPFGWNANNAEGNMPPGQGNKQEVKEENTNKAPREEEKPKPLETAISTDNKLADEIKEEVEGAKLKDDSIPYDWAVELLKGYSPDQLSNSPKMEVLFCLLEETILLGDRMLLFSQSLLTLNVIEKFLQKTKIPKSDTIWMKNVSYFRLDGSTVAQDREKLINEFNANTNVHLFLVSTRAGSLGINLVGANRVVVFDTSWNPCHDTQAVCRVYRYGQQKPCFVYRIVMDACLEKKIYDRQINKQGMSDRVVDECNPDAYLSMKEITNLCYDDEEITEVEDFVHFKDEYTDTVVQTLLKRHSFKLTKKPFQHESLFVDRKEKKLSSAEKRLAQRGYEMEKQASSKPAYTYTSMGTQYRAYRTADGQLIHKAVQSLGRGRPPLQDKDRLVSRNMPRPTTWIPADVWIKQGMEAREMTLPLDVVIPTSSQTKENIILKAGQRVMVLKSTKGIYMQLESGKIIAIRSTAKPGATSDPGPNSSGAALGVEQALQNMGSINKNLTKGDSDDDECVMTSITYPQKAPVPALYNLPSTSVANNIPPVTKQQVPQVPTVQQEPVREKPVYNPNLVQRKRPTVAPPEHSSQGLGSHAAATTNGGGQYGGATYNQHFSNYDQRPPSLGHNSGNANNTTFSHANAQNFSTYQHSKPLAPTSSSNFKPTTADVTPNQPPSYPPAATAYNPNKNYQYPSIPEQSFSSYGAHPYPNQMHQQQRPPMPPAANGGSFYNANTHPTSNPQLPAPNANNTQGGNNWQNWQNETKR